MTKLTTSQFAHVCLLLLWGAVALPVGWGQSRQAMLAAPHVAHAAVNQQDAAQPIYPRLPATGLTTHCEVIRVIDGDTVEIEVRRRVHVRLEQCWAPESRTKDKAEKARGLAAKAHLQELVHDGNGQATFFMPLSLDFGDSLTLGRALGYLWMDGQDTSVNQQQVDAGFARETKAE